MMHQPQQRREDSAHQKAHPYIAPSYGYYIDGEAL